MRIMPPPSKFPLIHCTAYSVRDRRFELSAGSGYGKWFSSILLRVHSLNFSHLTLSLIIFSFYYPPLLAFRSALTFAVYQTVHDRQCRSHRNPMRF